MNGQQDRAVRRRSVAPITSFPVLEPPVRRRPLLALPVLALTATAVLPASAVTPVTGEQVQRYSGAFLAPTRFTDVDSGFPGLGRRVFLASEAADGVTADVFPVDAASWGGAFDLGDVKDATGAGDLDVYFYADLGNIATQGVLPVTTGEYDTAAAGEKGFVPAGSRYALVFSPNAVNPTFTFTAFSAPRVDLSALDGVSVPAGATLQVVNDSADFATLRHLPTEDQEDVLGEEFDGPGKALRAGESVAVTFSTAGDYVFRTASGTATVVVTDGPGVGTPAA